MAVPGFRSISVWKMVVAVLGYLTIASFLIVGNVAAKLFGILALATVFLATNAWGARARVPGFNSPNRLKVAAAWIALVTAGLVALSMVAPESGTRTERSSEQASEPSETEGTGSSPAASSREMAALATAGAAADRESQAGAHLSAAADYREAGEFGLALVELQQALALAPSLSAAHQMRGEVSAEATAQVEIAQAQATTVAREASARATAAAEAARPRVVVVDGPRYSTQARVGGIGFLLVSLRNDGGSAAGDVRLQISSRFFDGFILRSASPDWRDDGDFLGSRYLTFPGLAAGQQREYRLNLVGKAAGEYGFSLGVYFDQLNNVEVYSGRSVVLP